MGAKSAKKLLNERYGKRGTERREKFREEAFSFYFGEIIKHRRKCIGLDN